jgi:uncharacterized membrane protein YdbT with pleckstrin-like domain
MLRAMGINLHPGEQVLFEGHPSWRSILAFYLKGLLGAALLGVVVALVTRVIDDEVNEGLVFLVVLVVIALTVLIGFIKRVATTYTITDRRLNIKRGLISREIQETRLERVQNVNYRQSAIQRMLGVGDVDFDTAAGDDYNFVFNGVADPSDVVHRVDVATGQGGGGLGDDRTEVQTHPPQR